MTDTVNAPASATAGSPGHHVADASTAQLVSQLAAESSQLIRDEIALARTEMTERAKDVGIGAGLFGAAGVLAAFGFGTLVATAVLALDLALPAWAAALIVAVVLFAGAGVAALRGRKTIAEGSPPVPEQAIANVKADVAEVKEARHREH